MIPLGEPINRSRGDGKFTDPFLTFSSVHIPKDWYTALDLALFLYMLNPQYQQVTNRVAAHFITRFEFVGKSGDKREQENLRDYLTDQLQALDVLHACAVEQLALGNAFLRIYYPFDRYLIDKRDGGYHLYAIGMFRDAAKFNLSDMTYSVPDPRESARGNANPPSVKFAFIDRSSMDASRIKLQRVDPRRIMMRMNLVSGTTDYIYRFEEIFIQQVKTGMLHQINETPRSMLEAIRDNSDYIFNRDSIYHFKTPTISGICHNGWGIPNTIVNYRSIRQLQIYKNADEAVAMDYILPLRLLSPSSGQEPNTSSAQMNNAPFVAAMREAVSKHRSTPTAIQIAPFPVTYQEAGGSGKVLSPYESIQFHTNDMLDGAGYPAELFRGSLQVQQVPTAIRLFESSFMYLPRHMNNALKWFVRKILDYQDREQMGIKLKMPSTADDTESKNVLLSLAAGRQVSLETALSPYGISDPVAEAKKRNLEDIAIQKSQQKIQADFERTIQAGSTDQIIAAQQQGQAGPGGGALMPSVGGGNVTPLDLQQQGQAKAEELLQIESNGDRAKALAQIRASNETLWMVTKQCMEEIRRQGASQGRTTVGQQLQQQ